MSELISDTKPPYEQFEVCKYPKVDCKYRQAISGRCLYETCIYDDELPVHQNQQEFYCSFCGAPTTRHPREMKINVCDSCLSRIMKTEVLPFKCVFCGASQGSPSKIPLSGICNTCFKKINRSINCSRCGN